MYEHTKYHLQVALHLRPSEPPMIAISYRFHTLCIS
jgi:hypothetical protein